MARHCVRLLCVAVCALEWTQQLANTQLLQRIRFFDNLDRDVDWSNRLDGHNPDTVRAAAADTCNVQA